MKNWAFKIIFEFSDTLKNILEFMDTLKLFWNFWTPQMNDFGIF